jgi:hypothetical protein
VTIEVDGQFGGYSTVRMDRANSAATNRSRAVGMAMDVPLVIMPFLVRRTGGMNGFISSQNGDED